MDLVITNVGRDFRPLDVLPLTPGFGEQRLRQRETHSALYVFDGELNANQPLVVTYETARNGDWAATLQRIERERVLIRSRAALSGGLRTCAPASRIAAAARRRARGCMAQNVWSRLWPTRHATAPLLPRHAGRARVSAVRRQLETAVDESVCR